MIYRKARISDVEAIHGLINNYAGQGLMLARARSSLYEGIREYIVAEKDDTIVGVGALNILWHDLAEIRSLAVDPLWGKQGIGRHLVFLLEKEARELGIPKLFALTYKPGFFLKCDFQKVENHQLPQKVWKECFHCPKFPDCDEEAVLKILTD